MCLSCGLASWGVRIGGKSLFLYSSSFFAVQWPLATLQRASVFPPLQQHDSVTLDGACWYSRRLTEGHCYRNSPLFWLAARPQGTLLTSSASQNTEQTPGHSAQGACLPSPPNQLVGGVKTESLKNRWFPSCGLLPDNKGLGRSEAGQESCAAERLGDILSLFVTNMEK